jgi:hypothetical protein
MTKLTVQDLAMFIGCEMQMHIPNPVWIDTKFPMYKLFGVDISKEKVLLASFSGVAMWYDLTKTETCGWEYIKPILRPLLSMSEDETLEYDSIASFWNEGISEDYKRQFHYKVPNMLNIPDARFSVDGLKYLISKQFDVFRWIEKGLAIDKTKINQTLIN